MSTPLCPRFWYSIDKSALVSDPGFLIDPTDEAGKELNPDVFLFQELRHQPCLILLGEPGSGKSASLREECNSLSKNGENTLFVNLAEYSSDDSITKHVFQAPIWSKWRNGERLHLFLDSYDECRLSIRNIANVLSRELGNLESRDGLIIRLACRSGVWPANLENTLQELWGNEVSVYVQAPLRREDAISMISQLGIANHNDFLAKVGQIDAMPMATTPLSLKMLAQVYLQPQGLPAHRSELYEQGCRLLCTEVNPSRMDAGYTGNLSPDQRLTIASRIAALTLLCGRAGITTAPDADTRDRDWISDRDLAGGSEICQQSRFDVTQSSVLEVLASTRLFLPLGVKQFGWVHRVFSEFLAARYLLGHNLGIEQVRSLITHPSKRSAVVPQLQGVAAWLGGRPDILQFFCDSDPKVLLSIDLNAFDSASRASATAAILAAAGHLELTDFYVFSPHYKRLKHPDIEGQLRPVVVNRNAHWLQRRIAIQIAEECCAKELDDELRQIVADTSEDLSTRRWAVQAFSLPLTAASSEVVKDLLRQGIPEDVDDEVKGTILRALWPDSISSTEIVQFFTPMRNKNLFARYSTFVAY
jgi:hypothetical protein